ncbi:TIGR03087 family PEP-CTERM/XrtA system glycosyltransferase [Aurantiacibacter spongiae]|uniref:TIGR03087 family PEP-CTERM/XrtA system glycosyltransferase n=1 Tax=Aurantiacibacter spongiae TaxID=2488860 RepID=A0A3N5CNP7_9SPHN|nr:TIGR03087 family PEP-CTERM/XrtA system glycosyltransferase [Aurantiacibacter spongiae]RPF70197.1 TIGR03087 family PEP-CTERM/XrtA system glycosyltransferase [Aurantiacibacter spongiae]
MSGEILFLAHRLPFPPDRGDRIRSYNILKALCELAPVHVGCLTENDADLAQQANLAPLSHSWCAARRSKPLPLAALDAILCGDPINLAAFRSPRLSKWVRRVLIERDIRTIYVFSGQMGQYVPGDWSGRLVVDLVDVDSAKFEAYAGAGNWPRRWIDAREGRLLGAEERRLTGMAETTLLVSEAEANLLRTRTGAAGTIRALPNGIDTDRFDPARTIPQPLAGDGPHIVFTGQMDYAPNIAASVRMATRIMPLVRQSLPDARFFVVGRAPSAEVMRLRGKNGTAVIGEVPDTRPWIAAADAIVAPITIARGVQNKVLEAMAMARPVIASPEAATGIDAVIGRDLIAARDDDAFAAAICELAADPIRAKALGQAARQFVLSNRRWAAALADLPGIVGFARPATDHHRAA